MGSGASKSVDTNDISYLVSTLGVQGPTEKDWHAGPSPYECALISRLASEGFSYDFSSSDWHQSYLEQRGWKLEISKDNSVALRHRDRGLIVIGCRGITMEEVGSFLTSKIPDLLSKLEQQQTSAESLYFEMVKKVQQQSSSSSSVNYQYYFTGYALGALVADALAINGGGTSITFESPGLWENQKVNKDKTTLVTFVTENNKINCLGSHNQHLMYCLDPMEESIPAVETVKDSTWLSGLLGKYALSAICRHLRNDTYPNTWQRVSQWPSGTYRAGFLQTLPSASNPELDSFVNSIRHRTLGSQDKNIWDKIVFKPRAFQSIEPPWMDLRELNPELQCFLKLFLTSGQALFATVENQYRPSEELKPLLFSFIRHQSDEYCFKAKKASTRLESHEELNRFARLFRQVKDNVRNHWIDQMRLWETWTPERQIQHIVTALETMDPQEKEALYLVEHIQPFLLKKLRAYYKKQAVISLLFESKDEIPIDESFIHLSMLQSESFQAQETRFVENLRSDQETPYVLYEGGEKLKFASLFPTVKSRVLLTARPGAGKTTTAKAMAAEWVTGKGLGTQFEWLFWITLRQLNNVNYPAEEKNIDADVIFKECITPALSPAGASSSIDVVDDAEGSAASSIDVVGDVKMSAAAFKCIFAVLVKSSSKMLWLLDGLDEVHLLIRENLRGSQHIRVLLESLIQKSGSLILSRPYYDLGERYHARYEILGFQEEDIQAYIKKYFFRKDKKNNVAAQKVSEAALQRCLQADSRLFKACRTPLYLELLCTLMKERRFREQIEKQGMPTMTDMYFALTDKLLRRQLEKNIGGAAYDSLTKGLLEESAPALELLQVLANESFSNQHVIIPYQEVGTVCNKFSKKIKEKTKLEPVKFLSALGFTNGIGKEKNSNDIDHYFIHLTLHEFLAALHWVNQLLGNDTRQVPSTLQSMVTNRYDVRYETVFGFIAGILYSNSLYSTLKAIEVPEEKSKSVLQVFLCALEFESEQMNIVRLRLIMRVMNELLSYPLAKNSVAVDWWSRAMQRFEAQWLGGLRYALLGMEGIDITQWRELSNYTQLLPRALGIIQVALSVDAPLAQLNAMRLLWHVRASLIDNGSRSTLLRALNDIKEKNDYQVSWQSAATVEQTWKSARNSDVQNSLLAELLIYALENQAENQDIHRGWKEKVLSIILLSYPEWAWQLCQLWDELKQNSPLITELYQIWKQNLPALGPYLIWKRDVPTLAPYQDDLRQIYGTLFALERRYPDHMRVWLNELYAYLLKEYDNLDIDQQIFLGRLLLGRWAKHLGTAPNLVVKYFEKIFAQIFSLFQKGNVLTSLDDAEFNILKRLASFVRQLVQGMMLGEDWKDFFNASSMETSFWKYFYAFIKQVEVQTSLQVQEETRQFSVVRELFCALAQKAHFDRYHYDVKWLFLLIDESGEKDVIWNDLKQYYLKNDFKKELILDRINVVVRYWGQFFHDQLLVVLNIIVGEWDRILLEVFYRLHNSQLGKIELSSSHIQHFEKHPKNKITDDEIHFTVTCNFHVSPGEPGENLTRRRAVILSNNNSDKKLGCYGIYATLCSSQRPEERDFTIIIIYLLALIKEVSDGSKIHMLILLEFLQKYKPFISDSLEDRLARCILSDAFAKVKPLLTLFLQDMAQLPTQRSPEFYAWLHKTFPDTKPRNISAPTGGWLWSLIFYPPPPTFEAPDIAYQRWLGNASREMKKAFTTDISKIIISYHIFALINWNEEDWTNSNNTPNAITAWFQLFHDLCVKAKMEFPWSKAIENDYFERYNNYGEPAAPSFKNVVRRTGTQLSQAQETSLPVTVSNQSTKDKLKDKPKIETLIHDALTRISAMASLIRILNRGEYMVFSAESEILLLKVAVSVGDQQGVKVKFDSEDDKKFFLKQLQFHKNLRSLYDHAAFIIWSYWTMKNWKKTAKPYYHHSDMKIIKAQRYLQQWRFHQIQLSSQFDKCELSPMSLVSTPGFESFQDFEDQLPAQHPKFGEFLSSLEDIFKAQNLKLGKCFISYAWESDEKETIALQNFLKRLKADLIKLGFVEVFLDVSSMHGNINAYMKEKLTESQVILLIGTPRLKRRITEQEGGVFFEYQAIMERLDPNSSNKPVFIPLLLQGEYSTAFPSDIISPPKSNLVLNGSKANQYFDWMTQRAPLGLIPTLFRSLGAESSYEKPYDRQVELLKYQVPSVTTTTSSLIEEVRKVKTQTKAKGLYAYTLFKKSNTPSLFDTSLRNVDNDGNCFFAAVAIQLPRLGFTDMNPQTLREAAVKYLDQHFSQGEFDEYYFEGTREDYCDNMKKEGSSVKDFPIIKAVALLFDVQIIIIDHSKEALDPQTFSFNEKGSKMLYVSKKIQGDNREYYDALELSVPQSPDKPSRIRPYYFS